MRDTFLHLTDKSSSTNVDLHPAIGNTRTQNRTSIASCHPPVLTSVSIPTTAIGRSLSRLGCHKMLHVQVCRNGVFLTCPPFKLDISGLKRRRHASRVGANCNIIAPIVRGLPRGTSRGSSRVNSNQHCFQVKSARD